MHEKRNAQTQIQKHENQSKMKRTIQRQTERKKWKFWWERVRKETMHEKIETTWKTIQNDQSGNNKLKENLPTNRKLTLVLFKSITHVSNVKTAQIIEKQSTKAQSNTALACHQKSNPIMTEKLETKIRNTEWNWCTKWQCGDLVRNKNWMLSPSCGFAMLDGCLGWRGGPWRRLPCARVKFGQYAQLVDSWRKANNYHAMATMSIPAGLFPTDLDNDQQDKVEMDRLLLRVWFASKHHHAISRCTLSRWRAFAHGAVAVANSCSRKRSLNSSSSTKKAFAKR